jgi:protein-S-isoprenylcysteine O-methyltransferase Ste14
MIKARALVALQFGLLGVLFLKPAGAILVESDSFAWIAAALYVGALTVFAFAYIALRPSLRVSPIPKPGAPLITVGVYKWFRHPMYLGVLMFGLGMLINNFNLISAAVFAALTANMIVKANYEDRLLRARHSNAIDYQQRVFGLLGRKSA